MILNDVYDACELQGIRCADAWRSSKTGQRQFEINMRHVADLCAPRTMRACFKRLVRGIARKARACRYFMRNLMATCLAAGFHHAFLIDR